MHDIEPFYNWRHIYVSEEDERSPFYGRVYSEFEFSQTIYNYYIHPQWDEFDSRTLYMKVLIADYDEHYAVIELIGEWNDAIENDIMNLKREVIDKFFAEGITKFILIGENVLNFHSSDDCYYEEWFEEVSEEDGWIALLNVRQHVLEEMQTEDLDQYFIQGGELESMNWRTMTPRQFYQSVKAYVQKRLA